MKRSQWGYFLLALALAVAGCSKSDSSTGPGTYTPVDSTWSDGSGGHYVRLNATSTSSYHYYNLSTNQVASLTDAQSASSSDWTLAFERINGKLNGGASGPGGVQAVDLARIGNADSTRYDSVTTVPAVNAADWKSDVVSYAVSAWYNYNVGTQQHDPSRNVYVVITAGGKYAKMMIDSIKNATMDGPGSVTVKFVYQPDSSHNLSGAAMSVDLDCSHGPAYFSFAQGHGVTVADPTTSMAWDFAISGWDLRLNGGWGGPGGAAAYPMYQELNNFDSTLAAPNTQIGEGYFQDALSGVFGDPLDPNSVWYDYNSTTHEILTKNHVYILKLTGGSYFKMAITNYYFIYDGEPHSGWITIHYKSL